MLSCGSDGAGWPLGHDREGDDLLDIGGADAGQDCQGNSFIDRVVELAKPVGTRVVLDGSSYPPEEVPAR